MQKAAVVALPLCSLSDLSPLLQELSHRSYRLRIYSVDGRPVMTAEGFRVMADASLEETVPVDHDLLILPGGRYTSEGWNDIRLHRFIRQYDGMRKWIATSCEGIVCLATAQILGGVSYSAPAEMCDTFDYILRHAIHRPNAVTVDANIVSTDGSNPQAFAEEVCRRIDLGH
jgi:putative intracellular protease/amidase